MALSAQSGGYGVVTNIYAWVALLLVLLTCGMETGFFRFANKGEDDPMRVYSTTLLSVGIGALTFLALGLLFLQPVADWLEYGEHPWYVGMMMIVVAMDAIQSIPFAYLRYKKRPVKFAALKLLFIFANIVLNIVFFVVLNCNDVFYAFAINLVCTASITLFFLPELTGFSWKPDMQLLRKMLSYSWPMLVRGIAGILIQSADKIIFRHVMKGTVGKVELGIYGASVKIAMIMAMITQAFRYAYEPFVFAGQRDKDNRQTYAKAMKFFIIFTLLAFLVVMGYLDVLKHIIAPDYWPGLKVVPIVMAAEIMMGIYFNLSFWYKLTDRTIWGAVFSGVGCVVLIVVNILFIPQYSYMACAWAGVAGYGTAMLLSYFVGQKYYPIAYRFYIMFVFVLFSSFLFFVLTYTPQTWPLWARLGINTLCIVRFLAHIIYHDLPLSRLPVVGKYFRKK